MEVCVDSIESALNASNGGAVRIELCAALSEGGLTPSLGIFKIIKKLINVTIYVMLRPRCGDFLYSDAEFEAMMEDAKLFKEAGANGFVFGILLSNGTIDAARCANLLSICKPAQITFHRAIDFVVDIFEALDTAVALGFNRILTSGGAPSTQQGMQTIKLLVERAQNCSLIIMPGGGITEDNLDEILTQTLAIEFHASARIKSTSPMIFREDKKDLSLSDSENCICSFDRVKNMIKIYNDNLSKRF